MRNIKNLKIRGVQYMKKIEFAQLFNSMGIAVIPLRHRGKEPASHMMGGSWERYKTLIPTEYDLCNWLWSGWQNYGVVAGWNNLAVLDFDDMSAYELWSDYFAVLNKHVTVIEKPFMVKSNRGVHVYITLPTPGYNNQKRVGVDVKIHGYVVGPGSTHPSGSIYEPMNYTFRFPEVYSLETILPVELFAPMTIVETAEPQLQIDFDNVAQSLLSNDYDPFDVASGQVSQVDLVTKVKQSVRIETLFPNRQKTSVDGRWYAALCPFHDDHRPSFWIDTQKQICGCETCDMKPLDVINLYSKTHNISNADAVIVLAKEVGIL